MVGREISNVVGVYVAGAGGEGMRETDGLGAVVQGTAWEEP